MKRKYLAMILILILFSIVVMSCRIGDDYNVMRGVATPNHVLTLANMISTAEALASQNPPIH